MSQRREWQQMENYSNEHSCTYLARMERTHRYINELTAGIMSTESTIECHYVGNGNKWFDVRCSEMAKINDLASMRECHEYANRLMAHFADATGMLDARRPYFSSFDGKCHESPYFPGSRLNAFNVAIVNTLLSAQSRNRKCVGRRRHVCRNDDMKIRAYRRATKSIVTPFDFASKCD